MPRTDMRIKSYAVAGTANSNFFRRAGGPSFPEIPRQEREAGKIIFQSPRIETMPGDFLQRAANLVREARPVRAIDAPFELGARVRQPARRLALHPRRFRNRGIPPAKIPRFNGWNR